MGERFITVMNGQEAVVELISDDGGQIIANIEVDGEPKREVRFTSLNDVMCAGEVLQLTLEDGRSVAARVRDLASGRIEFTTGEHCLEVGVMSERDAWLGGGDLGADAGSVSVSMPGKVIKLLAEIGDSVEQGQPLIIIEAMKMENEVKAGRSGVIEAIHVSPGQSVEANIVLMEVGDG